MSLLRTIFVGHPASVNESYAEHFGMAMSFGVWMLSDGGACLSMACCLASSTRRAAISSSGGTSV